MPFRDGWKRRHDLLSTQKIKSLDERLFWTDAQELVCVMVIPEAGDVMSFCFKTVDDNWFRGHADDVNDPLAV